METGETQGGVLLQIMNTACTMQPRNNVGQYDNKLVVPVMPTKDLNAMDINRQHQQQTVEQGQSPTTLTTPYLFQMQEARASGTQLQIKG